MKKFNRLTTPSFVLELGTSGKDIGIEGKIALKKENNSHYLTHRKGEKRLEKKGAVQKDLAKKT